MPYYYSTCCGAAPLSETDTTKAGVWGICSKCRDHADFLTGEQIDAKEKEERIKKAMKGRKTVTVDAKLAYLLWSLYEADPGHGRWCVCDVCESVQAIGQMSHHITDHFWAQVESQQPTHDPL